MGVFNALPNVPIILSLCPREYQELLRNNGLLGVVLYPILQVGECALVRGARGEFKLWERKGRYRMLSAQRKLADSDLNLCRYDATVVD